MASGAVEAYELFVLVTASHVLVVVGDEFWAGDPFLCAILVGAVHSLDLPQVVAAREKVDAPLVHPHHGGEVVPTQSAPSLVEGELLNPFGSAWGSAWLFPPGKVPSLS